jgi:hypothetical protein
VNGDRDEQRANAASQGQCHRPFDEVVFASRRALAPFNRAGLGAADNLLVKADRVLAEGDLERSAHLIRRAATLNYDDHEGTAPAAFAVSMMLFNAVTDALERSDEGDSRWLDAAVEAMSTASGWGHSEMGRVLAVVRQDYVIESSERRAIDEAMSKVPKRTELRDVTLPQAELAEAVTSVIQMLHAYRAAFASTAG